MKLLKVLLLLLAVTLVTSPAQAKQAVSVHEKIVNGFVYLVDYSGSMMMTHESTGIKKIEMAKRAMNKIDAYVPELGYQSSIVLFSPDKVVLPAAKWNYQASAAAIQSISTNQPIFNRLTDMESSFPGSAASIAQVSGPKAVFLFSDGKETRGVSPAESAKALYAANPDMTLYVVSVADDAAGAAALMQVAALNSNSLYIDAESLLASDIPAQEIVSTALYVETLPSQAVTSLSEILFATGKYDITPRYAKALDDMAAILSTRPDLKIFVEGFADPSGNEAKNQILSENRANAVKDYLVASGVNAGQIISKGRGEKDFYPSYKYDRRVDIMIIWQ